MDSKSEWFLERGFEVETVEESPSLFWTELTSKTKPVLKIPKFGRGATGEESIANAMRRLEEWQSGAGKVTACPDCGGEVLYCDFRDARYCPSCDNWTEQACDDPECDYCPGRPLKPSECGNSERHSKPHRN
jgi:hypothetical protein